MTSKQRNKQFRFNSRVLASLIIVGFERLVLACLYPRAECRMATRTRPSPWLPWQIISQVATLERNVWGGGLQRGLRNDQLDGR